MYGSSFCMVTLRPLDFNSKPSDAAAIPLPRDETTPPVRNMYFVFRNCLLVNYVKCVNYVIYVVRFSGLYFLNSSDHLN